MTIANKKIIYDNWRERFTVRIPREFIVSKYKEGQVIPRWYLPVLSSPDKYEMELWIFPLAPIVFLLRLVQDIFWSIWRDFILWHREIKLWRKTKDEA